VTGSSEIAMPRKRTSVQRAMKVTGLLSDYPSLLSNINHRIAAAQIRATLLVNSELVRLYWDSGEDRVGTAGSWTSFHFCRRRRPFTLA
jgi:hypothetical protein